MNSLKDHECCGSKAFFQNEFTSPVCPKRNAQFELTLGDTGIKESGRSVGGS